MDDDTTTSPAPPAPASAPPLTRPQDGRWVAGVAAGMARHFDIDPIIVRIVIVALTFFGGAGIALYGLGWLLIPAEGAPKSLAQQWTADAEGWWRLAGVAAVVLGGVLLAGALGSADLFVPLGLVAIGAWLLIRSDDPDPDDAEPVSLPADSDALTGDAPAPELASPTETASTAIEAKSRTAPVPTFPAVPAAAPASETATPDAAPPPPPPVGTPQPRSFLTPSVLAVVLLIGGLSLLGNGLDIIEVSMAAVMALCLLIVGLGLLVSVRWGRARGLIPLGLVLAMGLGVASLFDFPLWSGIGERAVAPEVVADVDEPIRHGIGELRVDLTDLDLRGTTQEVEAGLSIGKLVVVVPEDVDVDVAGEVSAGSLVAFDKTSDGVDRTITAEREGDDPDAGTLLIDLQVGLGEARVEVE